MPERSITTLLKYFMMASAGATGVCIAKHDSSSATIYAAVAVLLAIIAAAFIWRDQKRERRRLMDEFELLSNPGATIEETLEFRKIEACDFAVSMGMTGEALLALLVGQIPIDEVIATKLEQQLGIDAQFWLNSEAIYRAKLEGLTNSTNTRVWTKPIILTEYQINELKRVLVTDIDNIFISTTSGNICVGFKDGRPVHMVKPKETETY